MSQKQSYTRMEELANATTHAIGAFLAITGSLVLIQQSLDFGTAWHTISSFIYSFCLIAIYISSTLYHSAKAGLRKQKLQKLDHAIIYIMIAGSYTPLTLIILHGFYGWAIFGTVWVLAIAGLCLDLFAKERHKKTAITLYLGMGWLILLVIKPVIENLEMNGLWLLLAGGVAYTLGVPFYMWKSLKYHHMIWHLFVFAGSAFQYFAVLLYMVPSQ